jgi:hypothetical protein
VFVRDEWVCVDVIGCKVDCAGDMEEGASKPMLYAMACNADGTVKDVTMRYAKEYLTNTR